MLLEGPMSSQGLISESNFELGQNSLEGLARIWEQSARARMQDPSHLGMEALWKDLNRRRQFGTLYTHGVAA